MKKKFIILIIGTAMSSLLFVSAVTVDSTGVGADFWACGGGGVGPCDSIYGFSVRTVTTYNTPSPPGVVLISVDHNLAAEFGADCRSGGSWGDCGADDVTTDVGAWGTIGRGPGGSVSPNLGVGSYNISHSNELHGAEGTRCNYYDTCNTQWQPDYSQGGTLVVEAPSASVDLNISQWFNEKANKLLALLNVHHASAQTGVIASTSPKTTAIIVANVNLTDTKLTRISDDNYNVSFVLTNKSEKQENVHYRFSFIDSKEVVVLTQTYPANLTLEKNTPVFINEKLTLPQGLTGNYFVRVQALTSSGLPLGTGIAGQIMLDGKNTPYLSSCIANRKGYEQNEILPVTCSVVSSKSLASYTTENGGYIVTTRAFYGNEPVERVKTLAEITGGRATVQLKGLTTPGTYTLRSQVTTRGGIPSGKEVVQTFVVKGTAVSILNLMLDKEFYGTREEAKGTVALSVVTSNTNSKLSLIANLRGQRDECAAEIRQELNRRSAVELLFPITKRCVNPVLSVKVTDEKGVVLAEKTLGLESKDIPLSNEAKVLLAVVSFAVLFYIVRHEKVLGVLKRGPTKKGKK